MIFYYTVLKMKWNLSPHSPYYLACLTGEIFFILYSLITTRDNVRYVSDSVRKVSRESIRASQSLGAIQLILYCPFVLIF